MATLAQLRTQARQRADMVNSEFVSDSELNQYIQDSYAELYDILVGKFEEYYISEPLAFTVASGANTYSLPADFYKLRGVDRLLSGSDYVELEPFNFNERNKRSRLRPEYVRYRMLGSKLYFTPEDAAAGSYRLWYVPKATTLSTDASTVDGINGWEVFVVTDAAIKCLQKEESDVSVLMAQKMELKKRIEEMAANRDAGASGQIADLRDDLEEFWGWRR
jgi:hypothetical protein